MSALADKPALSEAEGPPVPPNGNRAAGLRTRRGEWQANE